MIRYRKKRNEIGIYRDLVVSIPFNKYARIKKVLEISAKRSTLNGIVCRDDPMPEKSGPNNHDRQTTAFRNSVRIERTLFEIQEVYYQHTISWCRHRRLFWNMSAHLWD